MAVDIARVNRRRFLRGTGVALAVPWLEVAAPLHAAAATAEPMRRLACFYMPDGVPMPLREDPAYREWSWFPHGAGSDFTFSKCLDPLEPLRQHVTVLSGFSHPHARSIHGNCNADQFLTGAATGGGGDYANAISLDQVFAAHVGDRTRL